MPGVYRNTGAPWTRDDGRVIAKGLEFTPTQDELLRKRHKLQYVRPAPGEPDATPPAPGVPARDELEDYATGNGWYLIYGEKVRGRDAAAAALAEGVSDGQD